MSKKSNKPVTIPKEPIMQESQPDTVIDESVDQARINDLVPEQDQTTEVTQPVQDTPVSEVVPSVITEIVPQTITTPTTPEQAYFYLVQNGTPLQKSVLESVDNFIDKNSGPFQYGLVAAVSSQAQLLQAILHMFKKEPRNTSRMLWSAIIYKASTANSRGAAFSEDCMMVGTQHWKWGKESYATYAMMMNLISHMASEERKNKVKDYVGRAAINRLELDQEQRDGMEHILAMYGV